MFKMTLETTDGDVVQVMVRRLDQDVILDAFQKECDEMNVPFDRLVLPRWLK